MCEDTAYPYRRDSTYTVPYVLTIAFCASTLRLGCRLCSLRCLRRTPAPTALRRRQLARTAFRGQPTSLILTRVQSTRLAAPGVKITLGPRNALVRLSPPPLEQAVGDKPLHRHQNFLLYAISRSYLTTCKNEISMRKILIGDSPSPTVFTA